MESNNRKNGTRFERRLAKLISDHGYWVHIMAQSVAGQPFDVIAVKNQTAYAIDCKVCANDVFKLTRIEPNQASAMTLWNECGNGSGWIALELSDRSIYMLSYVQLMELMTTHHILNKACITTEGIALEDWV